MEIVQQIRVVGLLLALLNNGFIICYVVGVTNSSNVISYPISYKKYCSICLTTYGSTSYKYAVQAYNRDLTGTRYYYHDSNSTTNNIPVNGIIFGY